MRYLKIFFVFSGICLLTACATPYQAEGLTGGYSDARLDENTVKVMFKGNGNTDKTIVENYALYRSAEVTLADGFDYFIIFSGKTHKDENTYTTADSYHEFTKEEKKHGKKIKVKEGYYEPGETIDVISFKSGMIIKMYHGKKPSNLVNAFDAHEIIKYLTPAVKPEK